MCWRTKSCIIWVWLQQLKPLETLRCRLDQQHCSAVLLFPALQFCTVLLVVQQFWSLVCAQFTTKVYSGAKAVPPHISTLHSCEAFAGWSWSCLSVVVVVRCWVECCASKPRCCSPITPTRLQGGQLLFQIPARSQQNIFELSEKCFSRLQRNIVDCFPLCNIVISMVGPGQGKPNKTRKSYGN